MSLALAALAAAPLCAGLIVVLMPLLRRYALARPNARSSHRVPTPQGGGIAVLAATLLVAGAALALADLLSAEVALLAACALALAATGAVDDIRPLPAGPRLLLQVLAVGLTVTAVPGLRILPEAVPLWLERGVLVLAGAWFVNLVNFMDGLDWMTVAEMAPLSAALALFGAFGALPPAPALVAAALCGAVLGFAPFNRPVARLFLGDVGSLPIGLVAGWLLLHLAGTGALAAALLLPLYYLADATLTLLRRLARRERVWEAHRTHFYQRATDHGFTVGEVVGTVFALNLVLSGLAAATLVWPAWPVQGAALVAGAVGVALVLARFAAPRARRVPA